MAQRGIAARPGILSKGTELVFVLAKGVKVIGPSGAQSADGLKAKWLKEGNEILVLSRADCPLAKENQVGL
jgi:hypothetical protein